MQVEIWSDIVCPWCYIGKRKFENALKLYEGDETFDVIWRPYQLDPRAPKHETQPVRDTYAKKFGGYETADTMIARVTGVANAVGLDFHLENAQRANTLDAHRLLAHVLHTHGPAAQSSLKELLLQAYFTDGRNVADIETLADLATAVGLDRDETLAFLASDEGLRELNAEFADAADSEITGVPHFVFDGRWAVPGAQESDVFLRVFNRITAIHQAEAEDAREAAEMAAAAEACGPDGCEVPAPAAT